jgi:HEAT repeat protein
MKKFLMIASVLIVAGVFARQQIQTNRLERELASLRVMALQSSGEPTTVSITRPGETVVQRVPMDPAVYQRLTSIEEQIGTLARTSDYLMDRGQVPLLGAKLGEMIARLNDPSASDKDRLDALKLLRRAGAMDEAGINSTMNWLNSATNAGVRQNILRNLEGMTNTSMQSTMMQLALNDSDPKVREQAVDNLGRYVSDPNVEAQLWGIMNSDSPKNVREEAMNALRRGPVSEARVASLQRMATDSNVDMDERLFALRALRGNEAAMPKVMSALANQAFASQDPHERARLFQAFNGFQDESLKVPLVYGLEDPNPVVRQRAADALSGFRNDPSVREWLTYVSQNDVDPQVRREAFQALENSRDRRR